MSAVHPRYWLQQLYLVITRILCFKSEILSEHITSSCARKPSMSDPVYKCNYYGKDTFRSKRGLTQHQKANSYQLLNVFFIW